MLYYSAPGITARLGVPYVSVYRAVATGRLDAELHTSVAECDPDNPCVLDAGTQGQHYAITQADAERWVANRRTPPASPAYRAGWLAAVASLEARLAGLVDAECVRDAVTSWLLDNPRVDQSLGLTADTERG